MKLLTQRTIIESVLDRWKTQYPVKDNGGGTEIRDALAGLDLSKASPVDVDRIIGNGSWTRMPKCDNCGKQKKALVVVGEEPDYESSTAAVCGDCLRKALEMIP